MLERLWDGTKLGCRPAECSPALRPPFALAARFTRAEQERD